MDYFAASSNSTRESPPQGLSQDQSTITPKGAKSDAVTTTQQPRIRRRNRMITSCLECRRRKLKCDKSHPCTSCVKFARDCVFLAPALDQASQLKLTEIKEKVGSLERLLERDERMIVGRNRTDVGGNGELVGKGEENDDLPANEDERDLEPTPLAVVDAAYDEGGEDEDLLDLGIQMGKMRITERIGGFFRPKLSQELKFTMSDAFDPTPKGPLLPADSSDQPPKFSSIPPAEEWLKPGPAYIAPSSGFFFGQSSGQASLIDFLPSKLAADRLVQQYFIAVHPISKTLHRPSFEKGYDSFWDDVTLGIEPPNSVQTVVFAVLFSGVVSMEDAAVIRDFGVSRASLVDNFRLGTETALGRANFLRTTKIEILQAFVMYLIPLCREELSRAHSVLVGAAIRMAECMGLHRDGVTYGMNPLEIHTRRLIWYQLCFLDIRTCEAQGPRPTIRRDDFDTKLPLNVDDSHICATKKPVIHDKWTDTTFSLIRYEVNEMMRTIWVDRPRLERREVSLTAILSKIETFKMNMAARYDHLIDDRIPIQKYAKIVKALLLSRLQIMVLHRYHNSVVSPMPERLRTIMISSGLTTLETAISLEVIPELRTWNWYGGAWQQYHTAFLLLMEVFVYPGRKEAERIWTCLDYIYECNPSDDRQTKARKILSELQQKTAVYQSMRGMRAPAVMDKHIGQVTPRISGPNTVGKEQRTESTGDLLYGARASPGPVLPAPSPIDAGIGHGRAPPQYAGVTSGASLWALPNSTSPEASSESQIPSVPSNDDLMADIDWDAFDALFPQNETELIQPAFLFPPFPHNNNISPGYGQI